MSKQFYGVEITDATGLVYKTEVSVNQNLTHKTNVVSQQPIDSKFPYHTQIGKMCYYSGTITGAFENNKEGECDTDYKLGDTEYRLNFIEWLHNGLTKTIKLSDDFIIQATIMGEINIESENTIDDPILKATFSWEGISDRTTFQNIITCINCGQILAVSTNYCPHCGQAVNS